MSPVETSPNAPLRSFGRRKGRPLSPRQIALMEKWLPELELDLSQPPPAELSNLFAADVTSIAFEIGFGGAEHILAQAKANPEIGYIGCEPFEEGIAKAVSGIESHGLRNIRLFQDDARKVIDWLPDRALAKTFILFPDPWPKARHAKRRLINQHLLQALSTKMTPGAELRVATDIGDYLRTTLLAFRASGAFSWTAETPIDWRHRPDDWPQTRYEAKAGREGRRCYYLSFKRVLKNVL